MAKYQNNNWYLDIDGTDMSSYVVDITLTPAITSVDITAGSGTDHMQRGEGLYDHTISITIYADDAGAYAKTLLKGIHTVTFGLEGSASGKPKHVQGFILTPVHTTNVAKDFVVFTTTGEATGAPTTDMFNGGVWA
jgi:hypothetical protein